MPRDKEARRRYSGPPGDDREYWLPRDRDDLDAAWDRWYAERPELDPTSNATDTAMGKGTDDEPVF